MKLKVNLLQESFEKILLEEDIFINNFYNNLFTIAPEYRSLFGKNIEPQRRKLTMALVTIIDSISHVDSSLPMYLSHLGAKHKIYQVDDSYYTVFGDVLIKTIRESLGDAWTKEVEQAWQDAFSFIVDQMLQGYAHHNPFKNRQH